MRIGTIITNWQESKAQRMTVITHLIAAFSGLVLSIQTQVHMIFIIHGSYKVSVNTELENMEQVLLGEMQG